ncbi:MAG TPA: ectoine/hydroxyectoine ABC transporter substrate-binding protein EhuB [Nocardioidaceae bacterium]|nr:ectoine/hydroxyectoine ABC transporter substrate-binding protein EhuB [Nocardioidaceae bacterium]
MVRRSDRLSVGSSRWSRRDLLRGSLIGGAALAAPSLLSACAKAEDSSGSGSGGRLQQLQSQGTITVGIAGEEPYGFLDGGELTGMDPTVQEKIWGELGIDDVKSVQVGFDSLIPGLNAGNFDVVAAGMFITGERCAEAQFSEPMYCAPEAFLVPEGNPDNLSDFKSAADAGVTVGVFSGAVEGPALEDAGVDHSNVVTVPDQQAGLIQLQQGRIDTISLTSITLNWIVNQGQAPGFEVTEPFTPTDPKTGQKIYGCGGAVFRLDDDDLVQAFNEKLADLIGPPNKLTPLIEKFGFGPETLPPPNLTTEKLCNIG